MDDIPVDRRLDMTARGETLAESRTWLTHERATRVLRWAAVAYAIAFAIHGADHIRRGTGVLTTEVFLAGSIAGILQLSAVAAVFLRSRWAPAMAVAIGLPDAIGIAAVHLLPHWGSFSDAFPGAHATGMTVFSWFAAIIEIIAALGFGVAGVYALQATRSRSVATAGELAGA
jgi:hypothetical protein